MNTKSTFDTFLKTHPVFTTKESITFLEKHRTGNTNTHKSLLNYYKKRGRIVHIRNGLYGTIPHSHIDTNYTIDPYQIVAKLAPNVVLSHLIALETLGMSYTLFNKKITYYSDNAITPFSFQGYTYTRIPYPPPIIARNAKYYNTENLFENLSVTSYERVMVDVLSRPEISGGWESIWQSLEGISYDCNTVLHYLEILNNATTYAKVGLFLEQFQEELSIEQEFLELLEQKKPKSPHYIYHYKNDTCVFVKRWNLIVPEEIVTHSWDEFSQYAGMDM